jgi:hypothetical protein
MIIFSKWKIFKVIYCHIKLNLIKLKKISKVKKIKNLDGFKKKKIFILINKNQMAKKNKNVNLYIGIGAGVIIIIIVIIGFATNWFQPKDVNKKNQTLKVDESNYDVIDNESNGSNESNESNESNDIINQNMSNEVSGKRISRYATDMLNYHNNIREQCGNTPTLKWNSELAKKSKDYAEKLIKINGGQMSHYKHGSGNNQDSYDALNAGENLARFQRIYNPASSAPPQSTLIPIAAKDAVNGWAAEGFGDDAAGKTNSKYMKNGKPMTGHYSAMNWKTSTELGCGYALGENNLILNVCHYAKQPANLVEHGRTKADYLKCTKPLQIKN